MRQPKQSFVDHYCRVDRVAFVNLSTEDSFVYLAEGRSMQSAYRAAARRLRVLANKADGKAKAYETESKGE